MNIVKVSIGSFICLFLFLATVYAAPGIGNGNNPTGGFGTTNNSTTTTTTTNNTGGFGSTDLQPLGAPPPPPEPVPLDGGVSLLIAAGVAAGARALYREVKNK